MGIMFSKGQKTSTQMLDQCQFLGATRKRVNMTKVTVLFRCGWTNKRLKNNIKRRVELMAMLSNVQAEYDEALTWRERWQFI